MHGIFYLRRTALLYALSAIVLCGCAHHYTMKLTNGTQIVTSGKPKLKGGQYQYTDPRGQLVTVPQSRVISIQPTSMAEEEDKAKTPPPPKTHWWQFWR